MPKASKKRPCRPRISAEKLYAAVDDERRNLSTAESVLGCLATTLDVHPEVSAHTPSFVDVVNLARSMISESVNRLDSVYFSKPVDRSKAP